MKKIFIAAVCCMAMLAGCQQAEGIMNPSEELIMSIEASIGDAARSRYAGDTPNDVNFTNGDKIGLSVNGGTFYEWEYQNASWKRADGNIAYWDNKTNKHTFKAFYPFGKITSEGAIEMPELTGQDGTMTSVAARDFLIAQKDESYATASGVVSLTFEHVSSLITIKLKGEGDLVGATINQITITGNNILTSSTYKFGETAPVNILDKSLNIITLAPENCTVTKDEDKLFYFIFNSGTANLSDVNLTIAYTSGGKGYTATLNGLGKNDETFISGEQHIFSLKIADGVLSISGNEIADWNVTENVEDIIINGVENSNNETY